MYKALISYSFYNKPRKKDYDSFSPWPIFFFGRDFLELGRLGLGEIRLGPPAPSGLPKPGWLGERIMGKIHGEHVEVSSSSWG